MQEECGPDVSTALPCELSKAEHERSRRLENNTTSRPVSSTDGLKAILTKRKSPQDSGLSLAASSANANTS